jgi:hypothetical protein
MVRHHIRGAERLRSQPDYRPPTLEQIEETKHALDKALADHHAKWDAVRAFSAQVERERVA